MDLEDALTYCPLIGAVVTVAAFLLYVFSPNVVFISMFAVGIVLMVGGYAFMAVRSKQMSRELEERYIQADARGFILSLDGPYIPSNDQATIEELGSGDGRA